MSHKMQQQAAETGSVREASIKKAEADFNREPVKGSPRILRLPHVLCRVGISRSSVYSLMSQSKFPRCFRLSTNGRSVGWLESSIDEWIGAQVNFEEP